MGEKLIKNKQWMLTNRHRKSILTSTIIVTEKNQKFSPGTLLTPPQILNLNVYKMHFNFAN